MKINNFEASIFINIEFQNKEKWFRNEFYFDHVPSIGETLSLNIWKFTVVGVSSSLHADKLNFDLSEVSIELVEKIDNKYTYERFIEDLSSFDFKKVP